MSELPIPISGAFDPYHNTEISLEAKAGAARDEQREGEERTQDLFRQIFSGANGKEALDHLRWHVDQEFGFNPDADFFRGAAYGFARQGQKSIITYIEALIRQSIERN